MEAHQRLPASSSQELIYSPTARFLHWLTVLIVAIQVPVGFYMVWRGNATNFDDATNTLFSTHKLAGFTLLWIVLLRLAYRVVRGAPPDEPTLPWWIRLGSHLNHWGLYALLLAMPVLGWLGVTLFGALAIFGGVSLPAIPGQDALYGLVAPVGALLGFEVPSAAAEGTEKAKLVFKLHVLGAILLLVAITPHVIAALIHHFVRGDGVLRRMLPSLKQRR